MKRILQVLCISLIAIVLLIGCQVNKDTTNSSKTPALSSQTTPATLTVKDYFPINNDHYKYAGMGNEYAAFEVYIDFTSENKVQQRVNNGGTEVADVYELKEGKVIRTFSRGEVYYRQNFLEEKEGAQEIILMEPLAVGNSWKLQDSSIRTITNINSKVDTPMGNMEAIEVTTQVTDGVTYSYYAKNIGLIKTVSKFGDLEVSSTIEKIDKNAPFTQNVNFHYPVSGSNKLHYISRNVSFKTNDITKAVLSEAYKKAIEEKLDKTINTDIKINSLYLNKDGMVYIDLNNAFITEINSQKAFEKAILQCIANTFGEYFLSQKVVLTIDNNLYKSNNISLKKGEYLKVDSIDNAVKD